MSYIDGFVCAVADADREAYRRHAEQAAQVVQGQVQHGVAGGDDDGDTVLAQRQPDLTVLAEQLHKPRNLSAIVRTCDAVGIGEPSDVAHMVVYLISDESRFVNGAELVGNLALPTPANGVAVVFAHGWSGTRGGPHGILTSVSRALAARR